MIRGKFSCYACGTLVIHFKWEKGSNYSNKSSLRPSTMHVSSFKARESWVSLLVF